MIEHIHYGYWTIGWCDSDYGFDFAIANGAYRMDWRGIDPLCLKVGSFDLVEHGIEACLELITEIITEQKQIAISVTAKYVNERMGYRDSIAPIPSIDKEDADKVRL